MYIYEMAVELTFEKNQLLALVAGPTHISCTSCLMCYVEKQADLRISHVVH